MDWITSQIAIGNFIDARECRNTVQAILCLKPDCCDERDDAVDTLCIPLRDGPGNSPEDIREAVAFIHDVVAVGDKVLVHCHAGRSRSVSIVAAYLMAHERRSREQALSLIQTKREIYLADGIDDIFAMIRASGP